jgi:hypothetical protein
MGHDAGDRHSLALAGLAGTALAQDEMRAPVGGDPATATPAPSPPPPAATAPTPNKHDKLGLVYPVRVRVASSEIEVDGKRVAIAPDMAVNAKVTTGNRRVIEYVLSPLLRYRSEAGSER